MKQWIKKLANILVAVTLIAVGINMLLGPHNIVSGGLTGISFIIETLTGIDRSITILVLNIVVIIITYFLLGKEVFINTVIGALLLPLITKIVPRTMILEDKLFSVIISSMLMGISMCILYKNNASTGGTAILPLILKKYFNINTSTSLFVIDCCVVVSSVFVYDLQSTIYAVFVIAITTVTMNYVEGGFNIKKVIYIISEKNEDILKEILSVIKRGVTLIPAKGGYSRKDVSMLMVTINGRDYQKIINIINKYDERAFVTASSVSDVMGFGFTYYSTGV